MLPILLTLAFIAILIFIQIAGQSDDFIVTRTATFAAPPDQIFPHVNDLHLWKAWSPWAKLDPNAKSTFSGAESGVGAAMAWDGNGKVGTGKMTITASQPAEFIHLRLEFQKPMLATNTAEFTFRPAGNQTVVTWTMQGQCNLTGKIFGLFMNCEKMCGGQFEQGLASLKSLTEK